MNVASWKHELKYTSVSRCVPCPLVLLAARGLRTTRSPTASTPAATSSAMAQRFFEQRFEGLEERDGPAGAGSSPLSRSSRSRRSRAGLPRNSGCDFPPPGSRHPGRGHQPRPRGEHLGFHHLAMAVGGRHPALAPSGLDLPPRPDFTPRPVGSSISTPEVRRRTLGPGEYVISSDEKTSSKPACAAIRPPPPGRAGPAWGARIHPRRRLGLPGRLGCRPGRAVREAGIDDGIELFDA